MHGTVMHRSSHRQRNSNKNRKKIIIPRLDGKWPYGLAMIPQKEGKPLAWDATVIYQLADSYVDASARNAGLAAKQAADCKVAKYSVLGLNTLFPTHCGTIFRSHKSCSLFVFSRVRMENIWQQLLQEQPSLSADLSDDSAL